MSIFIKRNDSGDVINFTCEDINGNIVDLTGSTVKFNLGKKNKLIATGDAVIVNPTQGQVTYTLKDVDTLVAGNYPAEFEVTFGNGNRKTFPTIGYLMVNIEANLDLGKSSQITDQIVLKQSDIEAFKDDINAKVANLDATNARIDNILSGAGGSTAETVDARVSTPQGNRVYVTLRARLDDMENTSAKSSWFGTTTNVGNDYSVTLSPVPTVYYDGMNVRVKLNVDSTGSATLNVNNLGAKPLKKSLGNDVTTLKANGIYTFVYNSTTGNFILQGEGASGNATASDLLSGKTASTDAGDITGNMPNKVGSGTILTPGTADIAIPQGYYGGVVGDGKVKGDTNLIAANIAYGKSVFGVTGTLPQISPGTLIGIANSTRVSQIGTTATKIKETTVQTAGKYRVSYLFMGNDVNNYYWSQLYVNGVPYSSEQQLPYATASSGVTYTQDIYLNVGDVVAVYGRAGASNTNVGFSAQSLNFGILQPSGINTAGY